MTVQRVGQAHSQTFLGRLRVLLAADASSDELASLLGSKYAKWQEYTTEVPTRLQVKDLDTVLASAANH